MSKIYLRVILVLKGKAIGEALKVNTSLSEIYLYGNNIGDEGAKAIGEALKVNTSLNEIGIGNNIGSIGDEGQGGLKIGEECNAGCRINY